MKLNAKAVLEAVGDVLGQERAHRIALEAKVAKLEFEVAKLLADQERTRQLKAVPKIA